MRFVKTTKRTLTSVTTKGTYVNAKGKLTNHARKADTSVSFVGIDGEGIDTPNGHRYVLFGVGSDQIEDSNGLHWTTVFEFLYSRYRPATAFVGFFLGYDFTQILKTLPEVKAWLLLTREGMAKRRHKIPGKQPHPVMCDGWHFDLLGNKRLRLRPKECDCPHATCQCKHKPWMYICDVGSFFQSSFLKVIDPKGWPDGGAIVSNDEFETIRMGKEKRSTAVLDEDMRYYNRLENEILARVMRTLDAGFHDIGIHLPASKWFGPGQAAQAWLKKENVATGEDIRNAVPVWYLEAARAAYFGGWFEIFIHGIIPGTSHEYDINSAYPDVIRNLPCLLHGDYTRGEGLPPESMGSDDSGTDRLTLVYANVWSPGMPHAKSGQHIGAMLHRDAYGQILRPLATEGWFWWDELKAAENAGLVAKLNNKGRSRVQRWVSYTPCKCDPPMRNVESLYEKRLQVGKNTPSGKAAKLVYNSMYGKFAQSVGSPVFANSIYASRITSGCRTQILMAIASHPRGQSDVAMVATDGIYFLTPHPTLPTSEKLGEWEYAKRENLTLFKPGVYWDDSTREKIANGESASFKARGFNASDFARELATVDDSFRRWRDCVGKRGNSLAVEFPRVSFTPAFSMVTALQAIRRGKWELAGTVTGRETAKEVTQDADPRLKRDGLYRDGEIYRSKPHYGMAYSGETGQVDWIASQPYEKRFGMDDPFCEEYKQQYGELKEGAVMDAILWVLRGD